jgi:hypothetical protein
VSGVVGGEMYVLAGLLSIDGGDGDGVDFGGDA